MAREGETAIGPNGQRAIYRGGQWIAMPSGVVSLPAKPAAAYEVPKVQGEIIGQATTNARNNQAIGIDANKDRREQIQLMADLAKSGLRLNADGQVESIPNWKPQGGQEQTAARAGQLRDRVTALQNLENSLGGVEQQYDRNFRGQPIDRLGGLSEFVPDALNEKNQEFNSSAMRLGPFIQSILGLSGKEADAAAEYEKKVMPFIPRASDRDPTNENKLGQLRQFLSTQKENTYKELGLLTPAEGDRTYQQELENYRQDVADLPPLARQMGEQQFNNDPRIRRLRPNPPRLGETGGNIIHYDERGRRIK